MSTIPTLLHQFALHVTLPPSLIKGNNNNNDDDKVIVLPSESDKAADQVWNDEQRGHVVRTIELHMKDKRWTYMLWNEHMVLALLRQYYGDIMESLFRPLTLSMARAVVLFHYGGVYLHTKEKCDLLTPILLSANQHHAEVVLFIQSNRILSDNGCMVTRKNPFMQYCLRRCLFSGPHQNSLAVCYNEYINQPCHALMYSTTIWRLQPSAYMAYLPTLDRSVAPSKTSMDDEDDLIHPVRPYLPRLIRHWPIAHLVVLLTVLLLLGLVLRRRYIHLRNWFYHETERIL
jgi:hypothetical protein